MTTVSTEQCDKRHDSLKWWLRLIFGLIGGAAGFAVSHSIGANGAAKETQSKVEAQDERLKAIQTDLREIRRTQTEILRNHAGE